MALIYNDQGNKQKALDCWQLALEMQEKIGDKVGAGRSFNNLAAVFISQGDTAASIDYLNRAISIQKQIGNKTGMAYTLNNLGTIYNQRADFARALECHLQSLKIKKELKDNRGILNSDINIGHVYVNRKNFKAALAYLDSALKIGEEIGDKMGQTIALKAISDIKLKQNKLPEALVAGERSLRLAKELGYPEVIKEAAGILKMIYKNINQPLKAYDMLELYVKMRDSVTNKETRRAAIKNQLRYEYEKKEAEIKAISKVEKEKIELKAQEDKKRQSVIIYSILAGLLTVIIFSGFLFKSLKTNQEARRVISAQKDIVEEQKKIVEEKQKEILDSIHYARRIQKSLLPTEKYITRILDRMDDRGLAAPLNL